ncbi:dinitrogenase iron-molybdenum cofactor biosynthesis protein [Amphritea pacifica]|uniref:Dinitrogenase iron-molybdenum cofactor biosynthesis protein n=1 Tax=Amphritea pacifica TaxID=2811233 RepID=A0ABS2W795_9GAMM|nr:dinitrogenase iron-molybdenum cofactor biosynthesis protein [Amphritea pacifica]MBN0987575.1 dinitrogenase iron-molybdenum cofactor biosynthesis protein [Amphritea pacifica]
MSAQISNEVALRIGLAARSLPDTDARRLMTVLVDAVGLPITETKLARLKVNKLRLAAEGELEDIELSFLKKAVNLLKGIGVAVAADPLPETTPYSDGDMPGSIRVACASNNATAMDGHFGSCSRYLIYQVSGQEYRLIDIREANIPKDAEDKNVVRAGLIDDCQLLYTVSVGGPAAAKVIRTGVLPIKMPDGGDCVEMMTNLVSVIAGNPPPWLAKVMGVAPEERVRFAQGEEGE